MKILFFTSLFLMSQCLTHPVMAQSAPPQDTSAEISADATTEDLNESAITPLTPPSSARLEGLTLYYQGVNRCSAAALAIQLSHFEAFTGTYQDVVNRLNPYGGDVSVRIEEMGLLAEVIYDLRAVVARGGTLDLLKELVANGFPVLIENVYFDGPNGYDDWLSHNRVLMGYDDERSEFYFFDPLLGNGSDGQGRPMTYEDVDNRWRPFQRDFLLVYTDEDAPLVEAILGERYMDPVANAEWLLEQVEADLARERPDSFDVYNKGWALTALERFDEAAEAFDEAFRLGLPWRMLWYDFAPFEAYLAVGRNQDVINRVYQVLQTTDGVEEVYYYIALAFAAQGDTARAIQNLEAALYRNRYFAEAAQKLNELRQASGG